MRKTTAFRLTGGILCLLVFSVRVIEADQAVFFDEKNHKGNSLTLNISGGCYKFKKKWVGRASSLQVEPEACLIAWKHEDCSGQSIKVLPNSRDSFDLSHVDFDKKIKSVSLCAEISYRPIQDNDVSDRMGGDSSEIGSGGTVTQKMEINFYDQPDFGGSIFTLTLYESGECYNFKPKWQNKIASMELQGSCIKVWDTTNCDGSFIRLTSSNTSPEEFRNLKRIRLDNRIKSAKLCAESRPPPKQGGGASSSAAGSSRKNGENGRKQSSQHRQQENVVSDKAVMEIAMKEHNKYRRMHGVPELQWDESLFKTAQSYANFLARNNKFEHSDDNLDLGENLAGTTTENKLGALKEAIGLWYHEIAHYNFNNPGRSVMGIKAGHFTQIVWKATTSVAVGMAWNPRRSWWVIVANYSPSGNFKGEYEKNVFPPISS